MTKLTLKVITQILDENGNPVKSSSCSVPLGDVDEFDHEAKKNGFVKAFDKQGAYVHHLILNGSEDSNPRSMLSR